MISDQTAPPKRMRLGTRSCVECRRRKVRCVFQEPSTICDACILHGVECLAQQAPVAPKAKSTTLNIQHSTGEDCTSDALLKRLNEMETMIKQIRTAAVASGAEKQSTVYDFLLPTTPSPSSTSQDHANSCEQLSITANRLPGLGKLRHTVAGTDISTRGASDALEMFGDTPLVSFFRQALNLPEGGSHVQSASVSFPLHLPEPPQQPAVSTSTPSLPSDSCLRAIFDITRQCFVVFPPCSFYQPPASLSRSPSTMSPQLNQSDPASIVADIRAAVQSSDLDAAAKALLWVALCLFELPRAWTLQYPELSDTLSLINSYRRQAASMLAIAAEEGDCTRQTVEARCLEVTLNIDLGYPRKAWISARRAVSACLLLAYHRAARQDRPQEHSLWHMALYMERETSMILGLPSSVSNNNKCLLPILPPDEMRLSPEFRLLHEMTFLLGSVSDLYQALMAPPLPGVPTDNLSANYASTIQLDQQWDSLRRLMPQSFWDEDSASLHISSLQPVELYMRQTSKMRYFILGRHIHLPYALRANRDKRYGYSRTACLEASRNIIHAYQTLRRFASAQWSPCGLLDFESFSAAMVIVLTMLQDTGPSQGRPEPQRSREDEEDLHLLMELSLTFRKAHLLKASCGVAQRAADVMEIFVPILQGQYQSHTTSDIVKRISTADHDITIPFFGRLRVTFPQIEPQPSPLSSSSSTTGTITSIPGDTYMAYADHVNQMPLPQPLIVPPIIEFGVPLCNQDFHLGFDNDLELNSNWMSSMEGGIYDWNTLYAPPPNQ